MHIGIIRTEIVFRHRIRQKVGKRLFLVFVCEIIIAHGNVAFAHGQGIVHLVGRVLSARAARRGFGNVVAGIQIFQFFIQFFLNFFYLFVKIGFQSLENVRKDS